MKRRDPLPASQFPLGISPLWSHDPHGQEAQWATKVAIVGEPEEGESQEGNQGPGGSFMDPGSTCHVGHPWFWGSQEPGGDPPDR